MNKLLVICGPTASGKTALAVQLAQSFNGELVSADSRQVYIGMDIGTGKDLAIKQSIQDLVLSIENISGTYTVVPYDMQGIPIWLYDVVRPNEDFSVSQYQQLARAVIADIGRRGKLPIVVGGTGFYIHSILGNLATAGIAPDLPLRARLATKSVSELQDMVKTLASEAFAALNHSDKHNPRRLVRRIEIASGKKSEAPSSAPSFDVHLCGLTAPASVLYRRIDDRVDKRVGQGIIREIEALLERGVAWDAPSMSGLGYRQWKPYFSAAHADKAAVKEAVIAKWKYDEHGFARRQMTWFKKQPGIHWHDIGDASLLHDVTAEVGKWYTT